MPMKSWGPHDKDARGPQHPHSAHPDHHLSLLHPSLKCCILSWLRGGFVEPGRKAKRPPLYWDPSLVTHPFDFKLLLFLHLQTCSSLHPTIPFVKSWPFSSCPSTSSVPAAPTLPYPRQSVQLVPQKSSTTSPMAVSQSWLSSLPL